MTAAALRAGLAALALFAPSLARAGDPPAHTAATVRAARRVVQETAFAKGVGAPLVNGVPAAGLFAIPTGTSAELSCPYEAGDAALHGCSYADVNGAAINEPDHWSCLSRSQSPVISALNLRLSWDESILATIADLFDDRAAMACNYNHFVDNPALGPEYSAAFAAAMTELYAARIPALIASPLRTLYCTKDNWDIYYHEVVNGLHYLQDMQTEHHAVGNAVCGADNIVPTQTYNESFGFARAQSCSDFLDQTLASAIGLTPSIACDSEVVSGLPGNATPRVTSIAMTALHAVCNLGSTLACLGTERTLRHHCKLPDSSKSLSCSGPAGDHNVPASAQYCEGEIHAGAGQDFLTPATSVSVVGLEVASLLWSAVCKQPDAPCDRDECDTWCKHSVDPDALRGSGDDSGDEVVGYCVNGTPSASCTLQTCRCALNTQCGAHGDACCPGDMCNSPGDTCSAATGTCVATGPAPACPPPPPPPSTVGASAGDPHLRTFDGLRYDLQAVGELTLARDPDDGMEVQVRTRPWGPGSSVAINAAVAARVGSDVVGFYLDGTVRRNHATIDLAGGKTALTGGALYRRGSSYTVEWQDGTQLSFALIGTFISLQLRPAEARRGHMIGLLGNFDGNPTNDLSTRGGAALPSPLPFTVLYTVYAESWRIAQADSLFDYAPGETTETFTNRAFPPVLATTLGLSDATRTVSTAVCGAAGVATDWFDACLLDVGTTGDARFARDLAKLPPTPMTTVVTPPAGATALIPGLFPTGVDDAGVGLASGVEDPHYAILDPAQSAIVINPGNAAWIPNTPRYRWVWQTASATPTSVTRTFRITFSLEGLVPSTASISGTWASDNLGPGIALNGHDLGMPTQHQFQSFTSFAIPAGTAFFVPGINTLDFTVTDLGGVAGFLVGSLSGTAEPIARGSTR